MTSAKPGTSTRAPPHPPSLRAASSQVSVPTATKLLSDSKRGGGGGRALLQSGSRLQRGMGRGVKAQTGPTPSPPPRCNPPRLQRPPNSGASARASPAPPPPPPEKRAWTRGAGPVPASDPGGPEGKSGSRSPVLGVRRPAMLKFPTDWHSRCHGGTRWQRRRAGNRGDRTCSPPGTRGGGGRHRSNPPISQHGAYIALPLLPAHIPTAKAITAGARETF